MSNDVIPWDADQPNVLHALTRKRAEIAGQIEHNQLTLRHLIAELDHVDATIRIFNPAVDIGAIRSKPVPPRHAAFKGEVTRVVFKTLREATAPVTSRDIAIRLMNERGLNPDDKELSVIMVKRVCACLRVQKNKGLIRNAESFGNLQGWEAVR
uniref:Uncharacterized protein n=1 Tax=Caulobacter sp. (strain K31) TaxID=366602 RepID=B0SXQ2_CAUSK